MAVHTQGSRDDPAAQVRMSRERTARSVTARALRRLVELDKEHARPVGPMSVATPISDFQQKPEVRPEPPPPAAPTQPATPSQPEGPRKQVRSSFAIPLLAITVVGAFMAMAIVRWDHWVGSAVVQSTNDATVRAELTGLAARVTGNVVEVAVQDYQGVRRGDLLMRIDPADYEVAVAQAEAGVAGALAALKNLDNQVALQKAVILQAEAQLSSAEARAVQAGQERERQYNLLQSTYGTRQRVEQVEADLASAKAAEQAAAAAVLAQKEQLNVLDGTRAQRDAEFRTAQANLAGAKLRLGYTRIVAPFDGTVGQRQVQPGDYVTVGGSLISVVPLPRVYVIANYKETQLTNVSEGQPVSLTVDTFPGATLHGRVERLSPASGSQFALLPPDNATGNFTKVVQRIPVRIALDPEQPLVQRLRPGMSVVTSIHTGGQASR